MKPKWHKFEDKIAKDFGGSKTKGSGNQWTSPGDIKSDQYLIECKQTDKGSYALNINKWEKISDEALFSFRIPIMSLQIQDTELIVLAKEDFLKLINNF